VPLWVPGKTELKDCSLQLCHCLFCTLLCFVSCPRPFTAIGTVKVWISFTRHLWNGLILSPQCTKPSLRLPPLKLLMLTFLKSLALDKANKVLVKIVANITLSWISISQMMYSQRSLLLLKEVMLSCSLRKIVPLLQRASPQRNWKIISRNRTQSVNQSSFHSLLRKPGQHWLLVAKSFGIILRSSPWKEWNLYCLFWDN